MVRAELSELMNVFREKKVEFLETLTVEELQEYIISTGSETNIWEYKQ